MNTKTLNPQKTKNKPAIKKYFCKKNTPATEAPDNFWEDVSNHPNPKESQIINESSHQKFNDLIKSFREPHFQPRLTTVENKSSSSEYPKVLPREDNYWTLDKLISKEERKDGHTEEDPRSWSKKHDRNDRNRLAINDPWESIKTRNRNNRSVDSDNARTTNNQHRIYPVMQTKEENLNPNKINKFVYHTSKSTENNGRKHKWYQNSNEKVKYYNQWREKDQQKQREKEEKHCTFKPRINRQSRLILEKKHEKDTSNKQKDFYQRFIEYENTKKDKLEKVKKRITQEIEQKETKNTVATRTIPNWEEEFSDKKSVTLNWQNVIYWERQYRARWLKEETINKLNGFRNQNQNQNPNQNPNQTTHGLDTNPNRCLEKKKHFKPVNPSDSNLHGEWLKTADDDSWNN